MPYSVSTPKWCLAVAAALFALSGCASMRAAEARTQYLRQQMDSRELGADLDNAWNEALKVMLERGYGISKDDREALGIKKKSSGVLSGMFDKSMATYDIKDGRRFAETDFEEGRTLRYRIEGRRTGEKTCRILFWLIRSTGQQGYEVPPVRDPEMELNLFRTIDPEAAAKIEEGADALNPK